MGGGDPNFNPRLRMAVDKAKGENMPGDNIDRAVKRGTGELDGASYEEIRYEGYGIGGAAVMVDCLTDNRTRTVADVRHAFSKYGGNLGTDGSVAFMFKHCGQFIFAPGTSEDALMEAALEAGAEDVSSSEDGHEIWTATDSLHEVAKALEGVLGEASGAKLAWRPQTSVVVGEGEAAQLLKLIDALDDDDDVQTVWGNYEVPDDVMEKLG